MNHSHDTFFRSDREPREHNKKLTLSVCMIISGVLDPTSLSHSGLDKD